VAQKRLNTISWHLGHCCLDIPKELGLLVVASYKPQVVYTYSSIIFT